ncbi:hypothetical protein HYW32_02765 [Candidatus Berkelbacteria bacterium]|nr:hypothetical protein [Candidatus Berkelbacteria bacterium]
MHMGALNLIYEIRGWHPNFLIILRFIVVVIHDAVTAAEAFLNVARNREPAIESLDVLNLGIVRQTNFSDIFTSVIVAIRLHCERAGNKANKRQVA